MAKETENLTVNKLKNALSVAKKVLWCIAWGVLGLLAIMILWLSVDKFIIKSPVPSFLGYSTLTIETGSMNGFSAMVEGGEPKQVSIGDLILIKKTNDYKIGDVITFLPEGDKIPTTHRIIGYVEGGYMTKGDANNTNDTLPISEDRVLGEVIGHYPKLGKFASWVSQEGWIYIVATLGIIVLGVFVLKNTEESPVAETETQPQIKLDGKDQAELENKQKELEKENNGQND